MGHGLVTVAMSAPFQLLGRLLAPPNPTVTVFLLLLLLPWVRPVRADCECGYLSTINGTVATFKDDNNHQQQFALFTDLLETDFTRLKDDNDLAQNTNWARQAFNLTRELARGDYGEMFAVENVRVSTGQEDVGDDAGLELVVGSELLDGMVPVAELDTQRLDLLWGTFRASMKVSGVEGTCAAFFWVGDPVIRCSSLSPLLPGTFLRGLMLTDGLCRAG
jgi:hypothetical protein